MQPRIQYATTSDGVSIAFWTLGEGTPLVAMPGIPFTHLQLEWQIPELRGEYLSHAETKQVIRYDSRGSGLSSKPASDYSLGAFVLDLEAVVDALGLSEVCLYGAYHSAPVALAFAAKHPHRVSKLILLGPYAPGEASPTARLVRNLLDRDWDLYLEMRAQAALGSSPSESAERYAAFCKECTTPEAARRALAAVRQFDVNELLPRFQAPALLVHQRRNEMEHGQAARRLASDLPHARLVVLDSEVTDYEPLVKTIDEFLEGDTSRDSANGSIVAKPLSNQKSQRPFERTPMVGRREERAQLRRPLERAISGQGSLLFVSGEAGVGKTRLEHVAPLYEFTCQLASLEPPPPEVQQLFAALLGNQAAIDRFFGVQAGTVPVPEFFSPESVGEIMAAA